MHATPSLVGRARELRQLRALLPAAGAARGGLAFLAGEPGIGKTALARAFADEARDAGATALREPEPDKPRIPPEARRRSLDRRLLCHHASSRT
jgi:MoxR-like ATPase